MKKHIREVRVWDLFTYLILSGGLLAAVICGIRFALLSELPMIAKIAVTTVGILVAYFLLKRFAIGMVLAYKAFAPMSIRKNCRYEPSCSTYMVMAINKYGLFIGVYKGLRRIYRCCPPNGGIDYP